MMCNECPLHERTVDSVGDSDKRTFIGLWLRFRRCSVVFRDRRAWTSTKSAGWRDYHTTTTTTV